MTGADVKAIRKALGQLLGQHISVRDLGLALGLAPSNAGDTVRKWEDEGPTGPAAAALTFMREATDIGECANDPNYRGAFEWQVRNMFLNAGVPPLAPERSRSA